MLTAKCVIFLLGAVLLVHCQKTEDGANCDTCKTEHKMICNPSNSPTTCDDPVTGCYKFEWKNNVWAPFNYAPPNCNECLNVHKSKDCNDGAKTCTTPTGVLHWNCNKNEECDWAPSKDPKACNQ
uniref:Uncharacterized protein n=1 Tax=Cacopsylla melanoneura TaxID=428564 RepID=A0A8D9E696_9HEMI